ncbi:unnamed protein product [Brassica rapa subsp. narinosa]
MARRYSRNEKEKWVPSVQTVPKRPPVQIPPSNNENLIAANKLTVMGTVTGKIADDARVRVEMNGLRPLVMQLEIQLPSGDLQNVELEYIKIEKHCFTCFSLLHEEVDCPNRPLNPIPLKERKLGITQ